VRKALVLAISSLFFYGLFRDMTLLKTLILSLAIVSAYAISRIPWNYVVRAKYPLIGVCLAFCPVLIIYPWLRHNLFVAALVAFFSFHSAALFLVTLQEKGRRPYKEIIGLLVLHGTASLNLFLAGHWELILPLSVAILIFLFVIDKGEIIPFMGGWTAMVFAGLLVSGVQVFGPAIHLQVAERYVLLASAFLLLLFVFAAYVKRPDFVTLLAFFGLLYVSADLLMSIGLSLKGVLLS
jgi:hypothetical protein